MSSREMGAGDNNPQTTIDRKAAWCFSAQLAQCKLAHLLNAVSQIGPASVEILALSSRYLRVLFWHLRFPLTLEIEYEVEPRPEDVISLASASSSGSKTASNGSWQRMKFHSYFHNT